jgi:hypothetical protein
MFAPHVCSEVRHVNLQQNRCGRDEEECHGYIHGGERRLGNAVPRHDIVLH